MRYFGIPTCPYCKKRVNLIRTWSLKKQGEYRCPRCGGISNIFLSPLVYVLAVLAVFLSGAIYFFHKFLLNDLKVSTVEQVILPFIGFFLLSLFMVYLEKPVIKRKTVRRAAAQETADSRTRSRSSRETRRSRPARDEWEEPVPVRRPASRSIPVDPRENDADMKVYVAAHRSGGENVRSNVPAQEETPIRLADPPASVPVRNAARPAARMARALSDEQDAAVPRSESSRTAASSRTVSRVEIPTSGEGAFPKRRSTDSRDAGSRRDPF